MLTIDQLKFYLRRFRRDPRYGICVRHGGWTAFTRACGDSAKYLNRLVPTNPQNNWIPARVQLTLSRKVRQVLAGQLYILETPEGMTWCIEPHPRPLDVEPPPRNHPMYIEHTAIGPKIRRLPSNF